MKRICVFLACLLLCAVLAKAQNEEACAADSVTPTSETPAYNGKAETLAEAFPELSKDYKPAYKQTSYWKWNKTFKITGITLMSLGIAYTAVYAVIDAAYGSIHEYDRPYLPDEEIPQKEKDGTPAILYLPGAAAFGIGAACFGGSFVFKHKAKKSVELNTTLLPAIRKDGGRSAVPSLTLSYSF